METGICVVSGVHPVITFQLDSFDCLTLKLKAILCSEMCCNSQHGVTSQKSSDAAARTSLGVLQSTCPQCSSQLARSAPVNLPAVLQSTCPQCSSQLARSAPVNLPAMLQSTCPQCSSQLARSAPVNLTLCDAIRRHYAFSILIRFYACSQNCGITTISFVMSACPHGTTRLPLGGF